MTDVTLEKISQQTSGVTAQLTDYVLAERSNAPIYLTVQMLSTLIQSTIGNGTAITFGSVVPSNSVGEDDDVFFDITGGQVYKKVTGAWTSQVNFTTEAEVATLISTAVSNHTSASDPHPIYLTQAEGDARYPLATATDPYPTYLTQAEGDARYPLSSALSESIDDRVAALLVAGSNITLTYNDTDNTLTIASTSSGGSGGASGIPYTYNDADPPTTSGQIRTLQASLAVATSVAINAADTNGDSSTDITARLKTGAIFTIAKDAANYVRLEATADYASGSVAVVVRAEQGTIATGDAVFLAIASDAPSSGGGGGSGISAGTITATAGNGSLDWANTTSPSGIAPPYTYEWYGSGSPSFAVGTPTKISGATSSTLSETGLATGNYYRRRVVIDALGLKLTTPETLGVVTSSQVDGDLTALLDALTANGFTPSTGEQNALTTFFTSISSLKSAIARAYGFVGGTANTHRLSWLAPADTNQYLSTIGSITHNASGITLGANGSGLLSDYILPTTALNSLAWGCFIGSTPNANERYFGSQMLASSVGNAVTTGNDPYFNFYANTSTGIFLNATSFAPTWIGISRTSSTNVIIIRGTTATTTSETAVDDTSYFGNANSKFLIGGLRRSDGSNFSTAGTNIKHAVIFNRGLTQSELTTYGNAVIALQTALGR